MAEIARMLLNRFSNFSDLRCINFIGLFKQSYLIPEPLWLPEQMPDQAGRTIMVTGGNAGIGKECVKALLEKNANVYIASRNRQKSEAAIEELFHLTGKRAGFIELDLGDLASVKRAAEEFLSKEVELHVLINNAGVTSSMDNQCNGYDPHIHVHTLGHFYLTKLLLPALLSTRKSGHRPRVIHFSSVSHYFAKSSGLNFSAFKCGPSRDKQSSSEMYIQSKLANILLSNELALRHAKDGLISIAVNPGNLKTGLIDDFTQNRPGYRRILGTLMIYPPSKGAITPLWAAVGPETEGYSGKYLVPWGRVGRTHKVAQDPREGEALWNWLEDQISPTL